MKLARKAILTIICLMGLILVGTLTAEAKIERFNFDGMEYQFQSPDPADKEWIDEDLVLHLRGGAYYFELAHPFFVDGILIATTDVMQIDLTTGLGDGKGGNYLTAISNIPGYVGLDIELEGTSILKFEFGFIHGWATSKGTIGEHKLHLKAEFGPVFIGGNFIGTYLRGTLTIHI
ncbi:MAG: hypothetical protein KAS63_10435 [Candidatus Heimdallarchaeota archaeon]|nr:hypothetical protein [Candidatus Heimdallarchaeota archaeon]MCK4955771.1 hypothetical protein [Candidatus Heimdallarchaeota archaeon]